MITPEQRAYLALLRLPINGPRATAALQSAMATLRDHIAEVAGKDREIVQTLCEEIAAFPAQPLAEWQPIKTAPKDGSEFLAWPCETSEGEIVTKARWYVHPSVTGWITNEIDCGDYDFKPTHWMPLPEAPTPSKEP